MNNIIEFVKQCIFSKQELLDFLYFTSTHPFTFLICIIFGLVLCAIYYATREPGFHEQAHYIAIVKTHTTTPEFKGRPIKNITLMGTQAHINSNYLDFLATNPTLYSKQIKIIARAGTLYMLILYLIIAVISMLATLYINYYFLVIVVASIFAFFISFMVYLFSYKEKYDLNGILIKQPDRFLVRHPEQFKNIHS